jgi:hypothetical protein
VSAWGKLRKEFVHAFALTPAVQEFGSEEIVLLEKIADLVVKRKMAIPALRFSQGK